MGSKERSVVAIAADNFQVARDSTGICASDRFLPLRAFSSGRGETAEEINRLRRVVFAKHTDVGGQTLGCP